MSLPFLILPYSTGVKETMKVVPSLPYGSRSPLENEDEGGVLLGHDGELCIGLWCEGGDEAGIVLVLVGDFEGDAGGPVEGRADDDDVVFFWLGGFQGELVLPPAAGLPEDVEVDGGLGMRDGSGTLSGFMGMKRTK